MNEPKKQTSASSTAEPETLVVPATPEELKKSAEGWWRTQSATMALLKHAYQQITSSEKMIAEQKKRIQELEDLAATDPLTGLMNRRGFEKFFDHELERIRRYHSPGALFVLIDLDKFKPINDKYGHLAGDASLKLVAEKLLQSIRILDGAARLGGDEFTLLLTQIEPEKTTLRIQKIRQTLDDMKLDWQGEKIHFGASIGLATVTAESEFSAVYHAADMDLYADKQRRKESKNLL